jgi:hypothetical protein
VNYCLGGLKAPKEHEVILYFDRTEPFMHQVNRVWLRLRKRDDRTWARQTRNIIPVDSSYYAIQAADLLAWSMSRQCIRNDQDDLALCAALATRGQIQIYDYNQIVAHYADDKWR